MQEKKGGIPGAKTALEKGRTVMVRKIIAEQWQKQKEGENI